jgi:hypothetical protein
MHPQTVDIHGCRNLVLPHETQVVKVVGSQKTSVPTTESFTIVPMLVVISCIQENIV